MTVEQAGTVDGAGLHPATGVLVLRIYDHLDWADVDGHLAAVRAKVAGYVDFVRGGQAAELFPDAAPVAPVVSVVFAVEPPAAALDALGDLAAALRAEGLGFEHLVR